MMALSLEIILASSCKESKKETTSKKNRSYHNKQNIKKNERIIYINIS